MVSYQLAPEQQDLRDSVAQFARDVVAPVIGGYYERGEFPYEIVARMGKLGLFGLPFPEEYGGMGGDYFALCLALEELARVDSSVAITLEAAVSLGAMPVYRFGTDEQRRRWLPELCAGERLAAFGLTEPGGGSDIPGGMRTTARLEEGPSGEAQWVIDGSKAFITNSGTSITSLVTVLAITGRGEDGRREISSVIVPSGTAGFVPGPEYSKVGWCASDTRELSFTGCRVPAGNLLGERGRGYAQFLRILDEGRVAIAALATGLAQGCVDECVRYAGQRVAFGRPIGQHQAIQFTVADMEARVHAARLAWYDAAARLVAGQPVKKESAIAKLTASNAAMDNARAATQVFGGYGFMNESPVGRFYRDAKVLEIGEGTSEVQRMLIARELGLGALFRQSQWRINRARNSPHCGVIVLAGRPGGPPAGRRGPADPAVTGSPVARRAGSDRCVPAGPGRPPGQFRWSPARSGHRAVLYGELLYDHPITPGFAGSRSR